MPVCSVPSVVYDCWRPHGLQPAGSSVHGILQTRILEWVAMPSFGGSSRPRDRTSISYVLHWLASSLPLVPPGKIPTISHCILIYSSIFENTHFLIFPPLLGKCRILYVLSCTLLFSLNCVSWNLFHSGTQETFFFFFPQQDCSPLYEFIQIQMEDSTKRFGTSNQKGRIIIQCNGKDSKRNRFWGEYQGLVWLRRHFV